MSLRRVKPWQLILLAYVGLCLLTLFIPNYGHPNFRYNGSDPNHDVWNFGFPLSSFIYDDRFGLIQSQLLPLILMGQAAFFIIVVAPILILVSGTQSKHQTRVERAYVLSVATTCVPVHVHAPNTALPRGVTPLNLLKHREDEMTAALPISFQACPNPPSRSWSSAAGRTANARSR